MANAYLNRKDQMFPRLTGGRTRGGAEATAWRAKLACWSLDLPVAFPDMTKDLAGLSHS